MQQLLRNSVENDDNKISLEGIIVEIGVKKLEKTRYQQELRVEREWVGARIDRTKREIVIFKRSEKTECGDYYDHSDKSLATRFNNSERCKIRLKSTKC
ncbi:hypothetical protein HZS_1790 [Henneguya salminicola]|nr:hypothetical protein HZS_1790 [Henneguya salminicola]